MRTAGASTPDRFWRRSALAGLGGAALLLTLVAVASLWELSTGLEAGDWSRRSLDVLRQANVVRQRLTEAETGQRGYILTGAPEYRAPYDRAAGQVNAEIEKLRRLTADNPDQQRRIDALTPLAATKLGELNKTVELRAAGDADAALQMIRTDVGKDVMDRIRGLLDEIASEERGLLQRRVDARAQHTQRTTMLIVLGNGLALLVFAASAYVLTRLLVRALTAEARRRESEVRLYVTLQSIGDGVIATDRAGQIVFMNTIAQRLTGWSDTAAAGKPLADVFRIVNERTKETVESPVDRVIREGTIVGLANHTLLLARDGREIPIDDSGAPISDGNGELMGVVLVFRDVTERNRAEESRRQALWAEAAREQAEQANEAKDAFLAMLSHELRSPLSAMLAWTRILQQSPDDVARRARALAVLDRNIRAQTNLINDLLDVSRIVSGKFEVRLAPIDLVEELRACLDALQPAAATKGITLTRVVPVVPLAVNGDAQRLTQLMRNLVDNAIKFTPEGGRVEIRLERQDDAAAFTVTDSGEGFAPELAAVIFERFAQRSDSQRRSSGLGLGLAIVRHIVLQHGGTVEARSPGRGRGATFVVRIPSAPASSLPTAIAFPDERAVDLRGVRVLVVEDDADWSEAVALRLEQSGAEVTLAASVPEALLCFDRAQPQVLVSDIGLPHQDGYELIQEIRSRGGRTPRTVAMTGFADAVTAERCRRLGFDVFLAKPFEPGRLVATIGYLLGGGLP